jgi:hypothetical protein
VVGNEISSELLQRDLTESTSVQVAITEYLQMIEYGNNKDYGGDELYVTHIDGGHARVNHRCQLTSKHKSLFFLCCTYDVVISIPNLSIYTVHPSATIALSLS